MARVRKRDRLVLQPKAGGGVGEIAQLVASARRCARSMRAVRRAPRRGAACGTAPWRCVLRQLLIVGIELAGTAQRGLGLCQPIGTGEHLAQEERRQRRVGRERRRDFQRVDRLGPPPEPLQQNAAGSGQHGVERIAARWRLRARPAALPRNRRHTRRPPGAAHTPACGATGAAPRQRPTPPAACRRFSVKRKPKVSQASARPGAMPQQRSSRSRAVSPSPRRISRPPARAIAASRRGLISQAALVGQFGRFLDPSRRAQGFGEPQRRLVPLRQVPLQRLHLPQRAAASPAWYSGQREIQQCRRRRVAERDRSLQRGQRLAPADDWRAAPCRSPPTARRPRYAVAGAAPSTASAPTASPASQQFERRLSRHATRAPGRRRSRQPGRPPRSAAPDVPEPGSAKSGALAPRSAT